MKIISTLWFVLPFALFSCISSEKSENTNQTFHTSLKEAFEGDFMIGAAISYKQLYGRDDSAVALIKSQFNSISPENVLKMGPVHPHRNEYNFEPADKYVAFGVENNMFIVGHTLVWHSQAPDWIYLDDAGDTVNKDTLLLRMKNHINTVVGRYKGKIKGWDVVNEALNDDGTLRQTNWLKIIGPQFLTTAFEYAHAADPEAELYYNDYNLWKPEKRAGAVRLVKSLQQAGIKVSAIGMQGHYGLNGPPISEVEESILTFADLGVKVNFTELDIDILPNPSHRQGADIATTFGFEEGYDPYVTGLPDSVQERFTERYVSLFELFEKHKDKIDRVTFWGVTDKDSWLNNWPMPGRTSYPLLFDRHYRAKETLNAIIETVSK